MNMCSRFECFLLLFFVLVNLHPPLFRWSLSTSQLFWLILSMERLNLSSHFLKYIEVISDRNKLAFMILFKFKIKERIYKKAIICLFTHLLHPLHFVLGCIALGAVACPRCHQAKDCGTTLEKMQLQRQATMKDQNCFYVCKLEK